MKPGSISNTQSRRLFGGKARCCAVLLSALTLLAFSDNEVALQAAVAEQHSAAQPEKQIALIKPDLPPLPMKP